MRSKLKGTLLAGGFLAAMAAPAMAAELASATLTSTGGNSAPFTYALTLTDSGTT